MTAALAHPTPAKAALTGPAKTLGIPATPYIGEPPDVSEMMAFEARHLMALPIPPQLSLHVPGVPGFVRIEANPPVPGGVDTHEPGALYFDAAEWEALVMAAEADRVWPSDLRAICQLKRAELDWTLTPTRALAGAQPDPSERWTVAQVLDRIGAQLLSVSMDA